MRRFALTLVVSALATSACGKKAPPPPPTTAPTTAAPATTPPATVAAEDAGVVAAAPDAAAPAPEPSADAAAPAPEPTEDAAAPSEPAAADAAAPSEPTAADATAPSAPDAKTQALVEQAKQLVATWLAAQNGADFAAYSALYAPRFIGVKRSGPRERTFHRAGWMTDRGRMFKHAMTVKADDIAVTASSETAIVTFVQTWASGTYQDTGKKQLLLVPTKEGLRIAREEMLTSALDAVGGQAKAIAPDAFAPIIAAANEGYVVLPDGDGDLAAIAAGKPTLAQRLEPTTVLRDVDAAKASPELRAWVGKKVTTETGCTGSIDRLVLVGRYVPHFGTVQHWDGTDTGDGPTTPLTDDQIAAEAWDGSGIDVQLTGHLTGCSHGTWVRDPSKPAPDIYADDAGDAKLSAALLAEFRGLDGWKAIQAEAKDADPPVTSKTWDTWEDASPAVHVWTDEKSGRSFAQVVAEAGTGCGAFGASFGALFEVKNRAGKPTFVLLSDPQGGPTGEVREVVDLDGDGDVEMLLEDGLIQRVGPVWQQTLDLAPPNFDCPC